MNFRPYSFSKISTWVSCPKKFKYCYIDKVPVEERDRTPLIKGGAIHSILEHYPNPSNHKKAPEYQHIVDEYLKSGYRELFDLPNTRELAIALDENFNPVEYSKSTLFRGYIDFVAMKDNRMLICDYKSGKAKDEKYQDYSQLIYYAIYMFNKYSKLEEIEIKYIYIEHNLDNSVVLLRKNLKQYQNEFKTTIQNLESSDFPKNITKLCDYCDYQEHCNKDL